MKALSTIYGISLISLAFLSPDSVRAAEPVAGTVKVGYSEAYLVYANNGTDFKISIANFEKGDANKFPKLTVKFTAALDMLSAQQMEGAASPVVSADFYRGSKITDRSIWDVKVGLVAATGDKGIKLSGVHVMWNNFKTFEIPLQIPIEYAREASAAKAFPRVSRTDILIGNVYVCILVSPIAEKPVMTVSVIDNQLGRGAKFDNALAEEVEVADELFTKLNNAAVAAQLKQP